MTEMIERAAKTISDDIEADLTTYTIACHAIEALREPSQAVLDCRPPFMTVDDARVMWRAMIDAANRT